MLPLCRQNQRLYKRFYGCRAERRRSSRTREHPIKKNHREPNILGQYAESLRSRVRLFRLLREKEYGIIRQWNRFTEELACHGRLSHVTPPPGFFPPSMATNTHTTKRNKATDKTTNINTREQRLQHLAPSIAIHLSLQGGDGVPKIVSRPH